MRYFRRAATVLVALAVAGVPVVVAGSSSAAGAAVGAPAMALVPCLTQVTGTAEPAAARRAPSADEPLDEEAQEELGLDDDVLTGEEDAPRWREFADHKPVETSDLTALPRQETTKKVVATEVEPQLPAVVRIPVYAHVIKGRHRGERAPAGPKRVKRIIAVLNSAYAGKQSTVGSATRYRFTLRRIDYTKRDGWYHAYLNGPRDQRAKRKLHRGNARTLNLYINGGGPKAYPVLGWSRFPWQYAKTRRLDGVSVNVASLPGGKASGYNRGDTAVHEVGHWLGLFHTFQGGCGARNDLVADTPPEGEPSYYCETSRDTCPDDAQADPVRNFMDYSLDRCMNQFTPGQVRRMDVSFAKWRS